MVTIIGSSAIIPRGSREGPKGHTGPTGATGPAGGGPLGAEGISGATGTYVLYGANEVSESGEDLLVLYLSNDDSVGLTGFKGPTYAYSPGDASGITIGGQFDIFDGHTAGTRIDGTTFWFKGISGEGTISVSLSSDGDTINISGSTAQLEGDLNDAATADRLLYLENPFVANSTGIHFKSNFIDFDAGTTCCADRNKTSYDVREKWLDATTQLGKIVGPIADEDVIVGITGDFNSQQGPFADGGIELQVDHGSVYRIETPIGITGFTGAFNENELFTFSAYINGNDIWAFPSNVYFETGEVFFSCGNDLVNFMSADAGASWIATVTSRGYEVEDCPTVTGFGSCCYVDDEQQPYCEDYVTKEYCNTKPGNSVFGLGVFNPLSTCAENCGQTGGICCIQGGCLENVGPDVCDYYGGTFWDCIEPPGGNGDDDILGSCCYQDELENWDCEPDVSFVDCLLLGGQGPAYQHIWGGEGSICPSVPEDSCDPCVGQQQSICCYFQLNEPRCEMTCLARCNYLGGDWGGGVEPPCNPDIVSECQCGNDLFPCTTTACCIPSNEPLQQGHCEILPCETCEAIEGAICVWDGQGNANSCTGVVCNPNPSGSCCVFPDKGVDSYCENMFEYDCYASGIDNVIPSIFHEGYACLDDQPQQCDEGICCCPGYTEEQCESVNSDWDGAVLTCEQVAEGCFFVPGWAGCALECEDCECDDSPQGIYCDCGDQGLLGGGRGRRTDNPPRPPVEFLSEECQNITDCSSCEAVEECNFCCDPCACDWGPEHPQYEDWCGACCLDLGDGEGSKCVLPIIETPEGETSNGCYSQSQCVLLGGIWTAGVTCGSMDCCDVIPYTGACCNTDAPDNGGECCDSCPPETPCCDTETCECIECPGGPAGFRSHEVACTYGTIQECYGEFWPNNMNSPLNTFVFMGHGTQCNEGTCECFEGPIVPLGSCCLTGGECVEHMSEINCEFQMGWNWVENGDCADADCTEPTGRCCYQGPVSVCEPVDGGEPVTCLPEELCCVTDCPDSCGNNCVYDSWMKEDYCRPVDEIPTFPDNCSGDFGSCCEFIDPEELTEAEIYYNMCQRGTCWFTMWPGDGCMEWGCLGTNHYMGSGWTQYECCKECADFVECHDSSWYPWPMWAGSVDDASGCECCPYGGGCPIACCDFCDPADIDPGCAQPGWPGFEGDRGLTEYPWECCNLLGWPWHCDMTSCSPCNDLSACDSTDPCWNNCDCVTGVGPLVGDDEFERRQLAERNFESQTMELNRLAAIQKIKYMRNFGLVDCEDLTQYECDILYGDWGGEQSSCDDGCVNVGVCCKTLIDGSIECTQGVPENSCCCLDSDCDTGFQCCEGLCIPMGTGCGGGPDEGCYLHGCPGGTDCTPYGCQNCDENQYCCQHFHQSPGDCSQWMVDNFCMDMWSAGVTETQLEKPWIFILNPDGESCPGNLQAEYQGCWWIDCYACKEANNIYDPDYPCSAGCGYYNECSILGLGDNQGEGFWSHEGHPVYRAICGDSVPAGCVYWHPATCVPGCCCYDLHGICDCDLPSAGLPCSWAGITESQCMRTGGSYMGDGCCCCENSQCYDTDCMNEEHCDPDNCLSEAGCTCVNWSAAACVIGECGPFFVLPDDETPPVQPVQKSITDIVDITKEKTKRGEGRAFRDKDIPTCTGVIWLEGTSNCAACYPTPVPCCLRKYDDSTECAMMEYTACINAPEDDDDVVYSRHIPSSIGTDCADMPDPGPCEIGKCCETVPGLRSVCTDDIMNIDCLLDIDGIFTEGEWCEMGELPNQCGGGDCPTTKETLGLVCVYANNYCQGLPDQLSSGWTDLPIIDNPDGGTPHPYSYAKWMTKTEYDYWQRMQTDDIDDGPSVVIGEYVHDYEEYSCRNKVTNDSGVTWNDDGTVDNEGDATKCHGLCGIKTGQPKMKAGVSEDECNDEGGVYQPLHVYNRYWAEVPACALFTELGCNPDGSGDCSLGMSCPYVAGQMDNGKYWQGLPSGCEDAKWTHTFNEAGETFTAIPVWIFVPPPDLGFDPLMELAPLYSSGEGYDGGCISDFTPEGHPCHNTYINDYCSLQDCIQDVCEGGYKASFHHDIEEEYGWFYFGTVADTQLNPYADSHAWTTRDEWWSMFGEWRMAPVMQTAPYPARGTGICCMYDREGHKMDIPSWGGRGCKTMHENVCKLIPSGFYPVWQDHDVTNPFNVWHTIWNPKINIHEDNTGRILASDICGCEDPCCGGDPINQSCCDGMGDCPNCEGWWACDEPCCAVGWPSPEGSGNCPCCPDNYWDCSASPYGGDEENRHLFVPEIERCLWFDCTANPDACRDYDDCSDHT